MRKWLPLGLILFSLCTMVSPLLPPVVTSAIPEVTEGTVSPNISEFQKGKKPKTAIAENVGKEENIQIYNVPCANGYSASVKELVCSEGDVSTYRYSILQNKNQSEQTLELSERGDMLYSLYLLDTNEAIQQEMLIEYPNIKFRDVNCDGYVDLDVSSGGTINETHELYLWNAEENIYVEVLLDGSDMLCYYEIYDGYILNWIKDGASSGTIQKLIWDGTILKLETEEEYMLPAEGKGADND